MRYRVDWYYETIGQWMLYEQYFFRSIAFKQAARKVSEPSTVRTWRVVRIEDEGLLVSLVNMFSMKNL